MNQSNVLKEIGELRRLESHITEKTGYKTKVYLMQTEEGKEYQVHVTDNNQDWKYINIHLEDLDITYNDFMRNLLHRPNSFKNYSTGLYGLMLENALEVHGMADIGYVVSHGELVCHGMNEGTIDIERLCYCSEISKMTVDVNVK